MLTKMKNICKKSKKKKKIFSKKTSERMAQWKQQPKSSRAKKLIKVQKSKILKNEKKGLEI